MADNNGMILDVEMQLESDRYEKDVQAVASKSKKQFEQSFASLGKEFTESLKGVDPKSIQKAFGKTYRDIALSRIAEFSQLQEEMRKTGKLPEGVSARDYKQLETVSKLAQAYKEAYRSAREFQNASTPEHTEEYAKWLSNMRSLENEYEKVSNQLTNLNQQMENYTRLASMQASFGKDYKQYKTLMSNRALALERVYSNIPGSVEHQQASADFARYEKMLNTRFKNQREHLEEMSALEKSLTFEPTYEGLSKANEQAKKLEETLQGLESKQEALRGELPDITKFKTGKETEAFGETVSNLTRMNDELIVADSNTKKLAESADEAAHGFSQSRVMVWSLVRVLHSVSAVSRDIVSVGKKYAETYQKIFTVAQKVVNKIREIGKASKESASSHNTSFKSMLKHIMQYGLGVRSLFFLFRKLRGYIKGAFEDMAKQIPAVNQTFSSLLSSLRMLQASLGTAFEPIISAITPWLNMLIEKLATAITYIGMFFAAFSGRNFVYKATKAQYDYAASLGSTNKQLQKFDELNNITTDKGGGAGKGPLANYEPIDVPDWLKNIADAIKKALKRLWEPIKQAWNAMKDYVISSWKRAVESLKKLGATIWDGFIRAWEEKAPAIFRSLFHILGDIGQIIANIADNLNEALVANDNWYNICKAVLTIIETIAVWLDRMFDSIREWSKTLDFEPIVSAIRGWLESLVPIVDMIMTVLYDFLNIVLLPLGKWILSEKGLPRLFKIFTDFNKKIDTSKFVKNFRRLWEALEPFAEKVGEGLITFIERLADRLANWINSDDFDRTIDSIVQFLNDFDANDLADDLEQLFDAVQQLGKEVVDKFKWIVDHKDEIIDVIAFVVEHFVGLATAGVIGKLAIDLAALVANIWLFINAVGGLSGAFAGIGEILKDSSLLGAASFTEVGATFGIYIVAGLVAYFAGYNLGKKLGELINPDEEDLYEKFKFFGEDGFWDQIFGNIKGDNNPFKTFLEDVDDCIKAWDMMKTDTSNPVIMAITQTIDALWTSITGGPLMSKIREIGLKFVEHIVNGIDSGDFVGYFKGKLNDCITELEGMLNLIIAGINLLLNKINGMTPPDWMQKMGVTQPNIPPIGNITIPRLAKGAVIPPNREFLAVLGDQSRGTNIETPLSTMIDAFNAANKGGSEEELRLLREQNELLRAILDKDNVISSSDIFQSVRNSAKIYQNRTGNPAFA